MTEPKTLPREPWRGGQICGYQLEYGVMPGRLVFCGERKAHGLYFCGQHNQDVMDECGEIRMAPGNAVGDASLPVMLAWEPYGGPEPVQPTAEETARYATA